MGPFTGVRITFLRKGNKSWVVSIPKEIVNERGGPHVETTETGDLSNRVCTLDERSTKQFQNGTVAVMYTVPGIMNGNHVAHMTVYFGPQKGSENY